MQDRNWSAWPDPKAFYSFSKPGPFCEFSTPRGGWGPWEAASGHPRGWRVVSMPNDPTRCGMRTLTARNLNPILFKTRDAAQRRADQLNA